MMTLVALDVAQSQYRQANQGAIYLRPKMVSNQCRQATPPPQGLLTLAQRPHQSPPAMLQPIRATEIPALTDQRT